MVFVFMRNLIVIILFIFFSCNTAHKDEPVKSFYDLKSYFENEASILQKEKATINKMVSKSNENYIDSFATVNWVKEFEPFITSDINRKELQEKYRADSLHEGGILKVSYTSIDENTEIKKIEIAFAKNQPVYFLIHKAKNNWIFKSHQTLFYLPKKEYRLSGTQKILFKDVLYFNITGQISW